MGGSLLGYDFCPCLEKPGGKGESVVLSSAAAGPGNKAGAWAVLLDQLQGAVLSQFSEPCLSINSDFWA